MKKWLNWVILAVLPFTVLGFLSRPTQPTTWGNPWAVLGVDDGSTTLGTFTGSTIADSSSVKTALQAVETALEPLLAVSPLPTSDDTYVGDAVSGMIAGEALTQWDTVYPKWDAVSSRVEWYKYDADGADKTKLPRGSAAAGAAENATFTLMTKGFIRNDGWTLTQNQDEGVSIYADDDPAGGWTLTKPSDVGDVVVSVGWVYSVSPDIIFFNPSNDPGVK